MKKRCAINTKKLVNEGEKVNVTAIMTLEQVKEINKVLSKMSHHMFLFLLEELLILVLIQFRLLKNPLIFSKKYSGRDMGKSRELLNIFQASEIGCHIITVTPDIINKMKLISYDLDEYSLDTVKMFYDDAVSAGYKI